MKRRVCCFLLGICILALPVRQVYAAPAGPAAKEEAQKEEKPKPHECKHEHEHEKPVPPHEKEHEHPLLPHEHVHEREHLKPHEKKAEEKKGPLAEKPTPPAEAEKPVPPHEKEKQEKEDKQPESTSVATPTTAPKPTAVPTVAPTATPKPTAVPTVAPTATPKPTATSKPTATPAPTESPKQDTEASELVQYALQFVGNPYKYGGTSLTNGADCSGFVQSVFAHFDYSLERTSRDQAKTAGYMNVELKESELQPGDLIFYANNSGTVCHVAIYIGDGKVVHAANATKGITISPYTYMKPCKARRVIA